MEVDVLDNIVGSIITQIDKIDDYRQARIVADLDSGRFTILISKE